MSSSLVISSDSSCTSDYSILPIGVEDGNFDMLICGHRVTVKRMVHGFAFPFGEGSSLYMHFDSFNEGVFWFLNEYGLWKSE
jgi:hypothetical protein